MNMGVFHCPIDAVGPKAAGCCNCGLCVARSIEERIAAADVMRSYIRANAAARTTPRIRKICVCGKGGTGKTTITSLFARALAEYGYNVLVIDTDESNPSLYRRLSMSREPMPLQRLLVRLSIDDEDGHIPTDSWIKRDGLTTATIPPEYIVQNGNVSLLTAGKVTDPLQGCACGMADITREIMLNLIPANNEIIIADLEAGVESFGRGVEQGADTILAVVEPSLDSVELAERIQYMSEGIGISRVRAVMNKIPSPKIEREIRSLLINKGIRRLGAFEVCDDIALSGLMGTPVAAGDAYDAAKQLVRLMLDEAEMT
jgi:CO dehydrogenase maturation factor